MPAAPVLVSMLEALVHQSHTADLPAAARDVASRYPLGRLSSLRSELRYLR